VVLGDNLVELLLGILGIGGELGGDVAQDCELLGQFYGNADEGAIGAEELVDLFGHKESLSKADWNCPQGLWVMSVVRNRLAVLRSHTKGFP